MRAGLVMVGAGSVITGSGFWVDAPQPILSGNYCTLKNVSIVRRRTDIPIHSSAMRSQNSDNRTIGS